MVHAFDRAAPWPHIEGFSPPGLMRLLGLALCALALLTAGCDSDDDDGGGGVEASVTVMSQNLYLGGDLFLVANETVPAMVPVRVAELYATVEASDPAVRMAAIAAEIARVDPALVGLQEVTTYAVQSPGDAITGGTKPATDVTYDFLQLLLDALQDAGADYRVVSRVDNSDVEFPGTTDGQTFFDVRYRDADVILARADVTTGTPTEQAFGALVTIPVAGVDQTFVRAFQHIPATVGALAFTFANTHLEVGGAAEPIQNLQAFELRAALAALTGPVVLVGDINSDGTTGGSSYTTLTTDFEDAAPGGGPTCCQDADLGNETSALRTRIDVVLSRGFARTAATEVVLDDPADRAGGLWPSDHAGVWAELVATVGS